MKQNKLFTEKFLEELQKREDFVPQEFFSWLFKYLGLAHRTIYLSTKFCLLLTNFVNLRILFPPSDSEKQQQKLEKGTKQTGTNLAL